MEQRSSVADELAKLRQGARDMILGRMDWDEASIRETVERKRQDR